MRAFSLSLAAVSMVWILAWPNVASSVLFDLTGTWSTGPNKFKCKSRAESGGEVVKSSSVGTATVSITQPQTTDGKVGPILHVAIGATVAALAVGTTNADTAFVATCTGASPASERAMHITNIKLKTGGSFKATLTDDRSVCTGVFTRTSSSDPAVPDCADPCL